MQSIVHLALFDPPWKMTDRSKVAAQLAGNVLKHQHGTFAAQVERRLPIEDRPVVRGSGCAGTEKARQTKALVNALKKLLATRKSLTVRLRARRSGIGGGIFGVRLVASENAKTLMRAYDPAPSGI